MTAFTQNAKMNEKDFFVRLESLACHYRISGFRGRTKTIFQTPEIIASRKQRAVPDLFKRLPV